MRTLAHFLVAALALIPLSSRASIPAPVPLAEAYKDASHVLLVRLVEGRTIDTPETPCGARYGAIVVRSLKGAAEGSRVEFGPYYRLRLGGHYLVFLANCNSRRSGIFRQTAGKCPGLRRISQLAST